MGGSPRATAFTAAGFALGFVVSSAFAGHGALAFIGTGLVVGALGGAGLAVGLDRTRALPLFAGAGAAGYALGMLVRVGLVAAMKDGVHARGGLLTVVLVMALGLLTSLLYLGVGGALCGAGLAAALLKDEQDRAA